MSVKTAHAQPTLSPYSAHIRDTSERAEIYTQHAPGHQHCIPAGIRVSHPAVCPPEVSKGHEVNFWQHFLDFKDTSDRAQNFSLGGHGVKF